MYQSYSSIRYVRVFCRTLVFYSKIDIFWRSLKVQYVCDLTCVCVCVRSVSTKCQQTERTKERRSAEQSALRSILLLLQFRWYILHFVHFSKFLLFYFSLLFCIRPYDIFNNLSKQTHFGPANMQNSINMYEKDETDTGFGFAEKRYKWR